MLVGIDFDNTIVNYNDLFQRAAVERGLWPAGLPGSKQVVRDELRRRGCEHLWTELQGYVYGDLIRYATPFPGVREFFQEAAHRGLAWCIISHKTLRPYAGAPYDLRQAARDWLHSQDLTSRPSDSPEGPRVFFEDGLQEKLARIAAEGCTHFVDDLPEFLAEPGFPIGVRRVLFDPAGRQPPQPPIDFIGDWPAIAEFLFAESTA